MVAEETGTEVDGAPERAPGLGPYRGPVVVLALLALLAVIGLAIAVVGAIRAPDDVSSSATILGTFPIDPDGEGIPPGPVGQPDTATTDSSPVSTPPTSGPAQETPPVDGGEVAVVDAFDDDLAGWDVVAGEWAVEGGALVPPAASDDAPAFLLATGSSAGIGGEIEARSRAVGLVVGFTDPSTYVAALQVPSLGGWRLEVRVDGEVVAQASEVAPTAEGTVVQLGLDGGRARLLVDGEEVGTVAVPDGLGDRAGFVARGPEGARWAAALEGP